MPSTRRFPVPPFDPSRPYVLLVSDSEGFRFWGPFASEEEASSWADQDDLRSCDHWIGPLESPRRVPLTVHPADAGPASVSEADAPTSSLPPSGDGEETEDTPCECLGSGFLVMNEDRYEPEEALGEIQACDCGIFKTEDDAIEAARTAGYTVTGEGLITSQPCRERALRRWEI